MKKLRSTIEQIAILAGIAAISGAGIWATSGNGVPIVTPEQARWMASKATDFHGPVKSRVSTPSGDIMSQEQWVAEGFEPGETDGR
jgi:hypothetical protein